MDNQTKRIMYIDHWADTNTNSYWLKAFKKFGQVDTFEIYGDTNLLNKRIMDFKPHHIHLGGSVKRNMVSPELLSDIKKKIGCTISVLYGDAVYSEYHLKLLKVVDYIYYTNKTHIKINKDKGFTNCKYIVPPTDPEVWKPCENTKEYDVVFIGNNYQPSRVDLLRELSKRFKVKVFGIGWENTGLDCGGTAFGEKFTEICSKSKINIAIVEDKWANLESYFSNRLTNVLATGCFFMPRYTPGLENLFTNKKHLVWYKDLKELINLIDYYLTNEEEREAIALEGQKEVFDKYTYENSVRRILNEIR